MLKNDYPLNCSLHLRVFHPDKPGTAIANKCRFKHILSPKQVYSEKKALLRAFDITEHQAKIKP